MVKQTVWKAGTNSPVVTIPQNERDVLGIEIGDVVEVEFKAVYKKEKEKQQINSQSRPKFSPKGSLG